MGAALSELEEIEYLSLLEAELAEIRANLYLTTYTNFYGWQRDFGAATAEFHECCLMAANQIGKTVTGTELDALHLLGDYPEDYVGHKFDHPPICWGLGYSMEKTRDLLQTAIFGKFRNNEFEGGLVPKERIIGWESATGTPNAMRSISVRHKSGISVLQFWSYSQGQHAIMGDVVDWVHVDEEPKDQTIRPQLLTRTINGDRGRGGRIIYTFTPENGRTDLVIKFMDDPSPDQFLMTKGWDDAPHLDEEKKKRLLASYPVHQRDMRTKGIPMLGHGRIYDIADEDILCEPFEIPDHFFVINGMDFGDDHPQAHIQLLEDRDNDIIYICRSWKARRQSAANARASTKGWARTFPYAWPQDGLQGEKGRDDAVQLKKHYIDAGCNLLADHATWLDGGRSVETGLYEIRDRMETGRFKIFNGQLDLMDEIRQYHRDERGRIVKVRDDLVDAMRYAYMMRRFAIRYGSALQSNKPRIPAPIKPMGRR